MAEVNAIDANDANDAILGDKPQRSPEELRQALVENERRLQNLKAARKQMAKQYREDINDVELEIMAIVQQLG